LLSGRERKGEGVRERGPEGGSVGQQLGGFRVRFGVVKIDNKNPEQSQLTQQVIYLRTDLDILITPLM
jgi:hypothetical protein